MRVTSLVLLEGTSQSGTKEAEERLQMLETQEWELWRTRNKDLVVTFCLPDVVTEVVALIFSV